MKTLIAIIVASGAFSSAANAQYWQPQCKQVYVCGGAGCQWVTVCR